MRLIYISQGNIPSRWAHSIQAMKMAEAFAALVPDFMLLTQAHWRTLLRPRFDFENWYGIRRPFRIVRLPTLHGSPELLARSVYDRRFDRLAAWYAARQHPDYVFTRSPNAGLQSIRCGLRTIIETHASETSATTATVRRLGSDPLLVAVVTVTETLKAAYVRTGIPEAKILVWPDAVDPGNFPTDQDRPGLRRQLGLSQDRPLAVYVGHLYEYKGVDLIVDAARLVPEVNFAVIGGWPEDIQRLRAHTDGMKNLFFHGFVPNVDVPGYLAAADILLLPNSARFPQALTTSPLKLFEYMASRRPIVATAIPALHGLMCHESNALVVEPDSAAALATGIRRLISDPILGQRLAGNAERDVQSYTWTNRARAILEFIGAA